jgi:hypothetical protein
LLTGQRDELPKEEKEKVGHKRRLAFPMKIANILYILASDVQKED